MTPSSPLAIIRSRDSPAREAAPATKSQHGSHLAAELRFSVLIVGCERQLAGAARPRILQLCA